MRTLDELNAAGYCTDEWDIWMQGHCGTYAVALIQLNPQLRFGVIGDLLPPVPGFGDDSTFVWNHAIAHDDTYAYDAAGRHPLPHHGVHNTMLHQELDQRPEDYGIPGDEAGPGGVDALIAAAKDHARRHHILEGHHRRKDQQMTADTGPWLVCRHGRKLDDGCKDCLTPDAWHIEGGRTPARITIDIDMPLQATPELEERINVAVLESIEQDIVNLIRRYEQAQLLRIHGEWPDPSGEHEGNLDQDPAEWLRELFEYEYCAECGGDVEHHDAVPFMGNWFARCKASYYDAIDCGCDDGPHPHPATHWASTQGGTWVAVREHELGTWWDGSDEGVERSDPWYLPISTIPTTGKLRYRNARGEDKEEDA